MLREVNKWWKQIMPWDTGEELQIFKEQAGDEKQWQRATHCAELQDLENKDIGSPPRFQQLRIWGRGKTTPYPLQRQ